MTQSENTYALLALCARSQGNPTQYQHLREQAANLTDWNALLAQAESHGLTPLLYTHLQAVGISIPTSIKAQLQTRAMQHSHANRVRAKTLAEVLEAFQTVGIDVLVLKGAALAHLIYPHPGLRVMRDVDILVSKSEVQRAQALLAKMGFDAPLTDNKFPPNHKHLPVAQCNVDGMLVSIEVHHNLYIRGTVAAELEAFYPAAIPFAIEGVTAYTLSYADMLEHVYRHLIESAIFNPLRLIGVADMVSLAEGCANEIDWPRVNPRVRNALALCHWLTPLSEELRQTAFLNVDQPPTGIGQEFQGWPRYALAAQRHKGYWGILRDSFFPAEWWLRFYYGLPSGPTFWWGRLARHPLHILGWVAHYFCHRAKN